MDVYGIAHFSTWLDWESFRTSIDIVSSGTFREPGEDINDEVSYVIFMFSVTVQPFANITSYPKNDPFLCEIC